MSPGTGDVSQLMECLARTYEVLGLIPRTEQSRGWYTGHRKTCLETKGKKEERKEEERKEKNHKSKIDEARNVSKELKSRVLPSGTA